MLQANQLSQHHLVSLRSLWHQYFLEYLMIRLPLYFQHFQIVPQDQ